MFSDRTLTSMAVVSVALIFYFLLRGAELVLDMVNIVGIFLVVIGTGFWLWSVIALGRYLTPGIEPKSPYLITTGPFSIVRHPIYFGASILFIGLVLMSRDLLSIPFLIVLIYVEVEKGKMEEERLRKKFPEFTEYRESVGFLFPRLQWKSKD